MTDSPDDSEEVQGYLLLLCLVRLPFFSIPWKPLSSSFDVFVTFPTFPILDFQKSLGLDLELHLSLGLNLDHHYLLGLDLDRHQSSGLDLDLHFLALDPGHLISLTLDLGFDSSVTHH
ncbi:jg13472 [Pararge aegeria aegeria]|uniref:Jg13472 protein n=1 Tax=Pararge aegeria aegeria TaxID=348720 RepID=A0A8S4R0P3_9NEOP|nr:jg13472 [Pararge aegeria aegeria]